MRTSSLVGFVLLLGGCGDDPSLRVQVDHPDALSLASTRVTIYESADAAFTCSTIEYNEATDEQLGSLEVATQTIEAGGEVTGELAGISRTGRKIVVARGFDASGALFTAGCSEHGTVVDDDRVTVETFVVATLSLGATDPGGNDSTSIPITVTGPTGLALRRRIASWRVYGPDGAMPMSSPADLVIGDAQWEPTHPPCTDADGSIRLRPVPPAQIGGYATEVRVSWGTEPPRRVSAFTKISPRIFAFDTIATMTRRCASRISGPTRRLVCVEDSDPSPSVTTPVARDHTVTVRDGRAEIETSPPAPTQPLNLPAGEFVTGIYSVDRDTDRDVYAISSRGRILPLFGAQAPNLPAMLFDTATEGLVADIMLMPACKAGQTTQLLVRTFPGMAGQPQRVFVMDPRGGPRTPFHDLTQPVGNTLDLNSAGCATELPSETRQVAVIDGGADEATATNAFFTCSAPGGRCAVRLPVARAGVGFLPGVEPRMVGVFFDATGAVLSSWVFLPDAANARLVEKTRMPAASFPNNIVTGHFDTDGEPDLLWSFVAAGAATTNFQIAYAREIGSQPLSALSGAQAGLVSDVFVGDVTGDSFDDVVILAQTRDASQTVTGEGVAVVPTQVPAQTIPLTADPICPQ